MGWRYCSIAIPPLLYLDVECVVHFQPIDFLLEPETPPFECVQTSASIVTYQASQKFDGIALTLGAVEDIAEVQGGFFLHDVLLT